MSKKLKDFDLDLVATKEDGDGASPASLTWISTSSEPCAQATVSLLTATSQITTQITTGSNYTESSDC